MALQASLPGLTPREAITDMISRLINAFDLTDEPLLESALYEDSVMDLNGSPLDGMKNIKANCFDLISKMDTTHFITNVRINVKDGDSKAAVTATAVAYHFRQGEGLVPNAPRFVAGCQYAIDCSKDAKDGLWKANLWKLKVIWTEGDRAAVMPY